MWYEDPAVLAIGVTAVVAAGTAAFFHQSLLALLAQYSGSRVRGKFWTAVCLAVLVLVPTGLVIAFAHVAHTPREFDPAETLSTLKWGVLGLVGSVLVLALVVGVFGRSHGATIVVDADDAEDLNRLLARVRELRARELLDQLDAERKKA